MMKKKQSTWWRTAWIAVTLPLVGFALTAFSKPKEALKEMVDSSVEIIEQPIVEALGSDAEVPEVKPTPAPAPEKKKKDEKKPKTVKAGDKITGTVKDAAGTLFGANIVEIDEYGRVVANTITDVDGNFVLKVVNPEHKIRISYVGLKTMTLDISSEKYEVMMEQATKFSIIKVVGRRDSIDSNAPRYIDTSTASGDNTTFNLLEQAPSFPGGQGEIMKYLSTHLRYPAVAREVQVEAEITVKFVVDKTGFVRLPKVASVNTNLPADVLDLSKIADDDEEAIERTKAYLDAIEALKEEAVYVVRNMPRWEPGRQNGKRVETTYTVPVSFNLAK
jgi:hypothetical protein